MAARSNGAAAARRDCTQAARPRGTPQAVTATTIAQPRRMPAATRPRDTAGSSSRR